MIRRSQMLATAVLAAALLPLPCTSASTVRRVSLPPQPQSFLNNSLDEAGTYQGNAAHDGRGADAAALGLPLRVLWKKNVGGVFDGSPLIANGKIAVHVVNTSSVVALTASSGTVVWQKSIAPAYSTYGSGMAEAQGVVYAPTTVNFGAAVEAFDFSSGQILWTAILPSDAQIADTPVVSNGVVFAPVEGSGEGIYALRATTGQLLWTSGLLIGGATAPAIVNGVVYGAYPCPQDWAFMFLGRTLWHYAGGCVGGGFSLPQYYRGRLYVGGGVTPPYGWILDARSGKLVGTSASPMPLAFSGDTAFMELDPLLEGSTQLQAVNLSSGGVLWTASVTDDIYITPPLVVGGVVFVEGLSGTLYAYATTTGTLSQSIALGGSCCGGSGTFPAGLAEAQGILIAAAGNDVVALVGTPTRGSLLRR